MKQSEKNTKMEIQPINKNLTVVQREAIQKIPEYLRPYVSAKDSPIISEIDGQDAEMLILDLIMKTQIDIGHTKSAEDLEINQSSASSIFSLIKSNYKSLTVKELKLAFLSGSISEYGDYIGVNLKSASQWIKGYLNDNKKIKAMAEWNKCLDFVKKREYSDEQKKQIEIDGCLHYFNEFKNNLIMARLVMPVDYLCSIFYLRLKECGAIGSGTFSPEKRIEMYERAKNEYENGFNEKNISKDIYGAMIQMIAKKQNKPFDHLCKRIALHEYFKILINNGIELSDEINKLRP